MTPDEIEALANAIAEKIKIPREDVDWGVASVPSPKNPRPQCGRLSDQAVAQLQVIAALGYDGATAQVIKTAVECYLAKVWTGKWVGRLRVLAKQHGITLEEAFDRILSGELEP